MTAVIIFIIVISILIIAHELGHFWAARLAKCKVEEFAIGFPPTLFKKIGKKTNYVINLLPIGGYVKIKGENGEANGDDPESYAGKSVGWKMLIVSAGVLMNILLAYILITLGLAIGVPTMIEQNRDYGYFAQLNNPRVEIVQILENTPAEDVLKLNDAIQSINGQKISNIDQLQSILHEKQDQLHEVRIIRNNQEISMEIPSVIIQETGQPGIGVGLVEIADLTYPWYIVWYYGGVKTISTLLMIIVAFVEIIRNLFTGAGFTTEITGPIGIAALTGQVAQLGFLHIMQFIAILSLNLAIINMLPFPALDGGRLLFIIIEKIRGKSLNEKFEKWIHSIGLSLLILLMIVVTIKDIGKYGQQIWETISKIF